MNFAHIFSKLHRMGQEHLLQYWETLSPQEKQLLSHQIEQLDLTLFNDLQKSLQDPLSSFPENPYTPFDSASKSGNREDFLTGKALIREGKVGCLLIAGGQGTRLQFEGPKGMFPISVIQHKTLFQLFAEKVAAASQQAQHPLALAVMTSPLNHDITTQFFKDHHQFGLQRDQVDFFPQSMLPFLDEKGNLFLDSPSHFAEGPDGNGGSLAQFVQTGLWNKWQKAGIQQVIFILVDNPLADPFDAELVGYHHRTGADVTLKCARREDPKESVGVLVREKEGIRVREYSEMSPMEKEAIKPNGELKYPYANLSLFCFSMAFIKKLHDKHYLKNIFLHRAFKSAQLLAKDQSTQMSAKPIAWKFERYIFDVLPFANHIEAIEYPRLECFSPLKQKEGKNSAKTVQNDLQSADYQTFMNISGTIPPTRPFELSQDFYYPTSRLLEKWRGQPLPEKSYIEP